jgi:hypothetical protein
VLNRRCSARVYTKAASSDSFVATRATDPVVSFRNYALNLHPPAIVEDPAFARTLAIWATLELYLRTISFSPVEACKVDIFVVVEVSNSARGIGMRSSTSEVVRFLEFGRDVELRGRRKGCQWSWVFALRLE